MCRTSSELNRRVRATFAEPAAEMTGRSSPSPACTRSPSPACAVGLQILQQSATVLPGQHHIKKVVAEMGGKNVIIIDADADLDEVVPAVP